MAWIESHQNIKDHPKTYRLMAELGCSKRDAIAIVHMIWWWCLDNALEGRIEVPAIAIKAATEWESDGDQLMRGLVNSGWLETHENGGWVVHDWIHYCGPLVEKRLERRKSRELKAASVRRPKVRRAASESCPTVSVSVPVSIPETKEKKDTVAKDATAPAPIPRVRPKFDVVNTGTPQAAFVDRFKAAYQLKVGEPYKPDREDFIIAARLLRDHGEEAVVSKVKVLGVLCERKSAWFTKDGWASFTIKKLSSQWNSILPEAHQQTKDEEFLEELKKQEAQRDAVNRAIGRR